MRFGKFSGGASAPIALLGMSEGDVPLRSWKNLEFLYWIRAIWWVLLSKINVIINVYICIKTMFILSFLTIPSFLFRFSFLIFLRFPFPFSSFALFILFSFLSLSFLSFPRFTFLSPFFPFPIFSVGGAVSPYPLHWLMV